MVKRQRSDNVDEAVEWQLGLLSVSSLEVTINKKQRLALDQDGFGRSERLIAHRSFSLFIFASRPLHHHFAGQHFIFTARALLLPHHSTIA